MPVTDLVHTLQEQFLGVREVLFVTVIVVEHHLLLKD
jgi:hypothetical protein